MSKTPRTIKAYAVVKTEKMKLEVLDIFKDSDVMLGENEAKCMVEIRFIKWIK